MYEINPFKTSECRISSHFIHTFILRNRLIIVVGNVSKNVIVTSINEKKKNGRRLNGHVK